MTSRPTPLPRPEPVSPGPGQESVWAYPRPPRLEVSPRLVEVRVGDVVLARSTRAVRVLETASPPTWYLPPDDVEVALLIPSFGTSVCEWKGEARYFAVRIPAEAGTGFVEIERAAWTYPSPWEGFEEIAGFFAFYPARVDCFVDGEQVRPQEGGFYGGWVTDDIVGPWKGAPGTGHW